MEVTPRTGYFRRFQLLVWPEEDGRGSWSIGAPDVEALETVCEIFTAIDEGEFELPEEECDGIPVFRFDEEAQQLFYDWLSQLEGRLRSAELRATPAFESHLAKYRSLMPSLALLFHLVDVIRGESQGPVSVESAKLAADWCEYLELHARKIYADELKTGLSSAHALADKIKKSKVRDRMTVREIYTKGWRHLASSERTIGRLWSCSRSTAGFGWRRSKPEDAQANESGCTRSSWRIPDELNLHHGGAIGLKNGVRVAHAGQGTAAKNSRRTRYQRTDKTDRSPSAGFVGSLSARSGKSRDGATGDPSCRECRRLTIAGVAVLACGTCGFRAERTCVSRRAWRRPGPRRAAG